MNAAMKPAPVKIRFFTPGVIVLSVLIVIGMIFAFMRIFFGIGAVTNLNNQYPWGIWIGIDVAAGVALAAGGFTTAALAHIFHRDEFHSLVRPALLTAMLGYTFVGLGVCFDLGRYYYIYHVFYMWNGNSVLFEVGTCVMAYLTTLYIEFLPAVTERFKGKVNFKGLLSFLNRPVEYLLSLTDTFLNRALFFFIILGVVLSCLHQSSLGTLMMIAGSKIHPLWQSPIAPLMYLLSAFAVGFPMVIMEGIVSARSFGLKPEMDALSRLARYVGPLLAVYLCFKIGDMAIRETFVYLKQPSLTTIMFLVELVFGVIVPLRMFFSPRVLNSRGWIFTASMFVIFGVALNRFDNFVIAYTPPYILQTYFPSIGEIAITVGFISLEIFLYRLFAYIFPVVAQRDPAYRPATRYAIQGGLQ